MLSHVASKSLEEVLAAAEQGQKVGWQLYMKADRCAARRLSTMTSAHIDSSVPKRSKIYARRTHSARIPYGLQSTRPLYVHKSLTARILIQARQTYPAGARRGRTARLCLDSRSGV